MTTASAAGGHGLTGGEIACIRLIVAGKTDGEIATALNIAPATAHWRIEQAKKKLGVRTRAQLTAVAVHLGLVSAADVLAGVATTPEGDKSREKPPDSI